MNREPKKRLTLAQKRALSSMRTLPHKQVITEIITGNGYKQIVNPPIAKYSDTPGMINMFDEHGRVIDIINLEEYKNTVLNYFEETNFGETFTPVVNGNIPIDEPFKMFIPLNRSEEERKRLNILNM